MALAVTPIVAKKTQNAASKFHQKLSKDKQTDHALSRLTFGARPGEEEVVRKLGLKKWIDRQLNPASIPENPELEAKLAKMETLSLSTEQLALKYPTPQVLAAVASGRMKMPEDPELRQAYDGRQLDDEL